MPGARDPGDLEPQVAPPQDDGRPKVRKVKVQRPRTELVGSTDALEFLGNALARHTGLDATTARCLVPYVRLQKDSQGSHLFVEPLTKEGAITLIAGMSGVPREQIANSRAYSGLLSSWNASSAGNVPGVSEAISQVNGRQVDPISTGLFAFMLPPEYRMAFAEASRTAPIVSAQSKGLAGQKFLPLTPDLIHACVTQKFTRPLGLLQTVVAAGGQSMPDLQGSAGLEDALKGAAPGTLAMMSDVLAKDQDLKSHLGTLPPAYAKAVHHLLPYLQLHALYCVESAGGDRSPHLYKLKLFKQYILMAVPRDVGIEAIVALVGEDQREFLKSTDLYARWEEQQSLPHLVDLASKVETSTFSKTLGFTDFALATTTGRPVICAALAESAEALPCLELPRDTVLLPYSPDLASTNTSFKKLNEDALRTSKELTAFIEQVRHLTLSVAPLTRGALKYNLVIPPNPLDEPRAALTENILM